MIPTDFSEHALYALKLAASIAKKMQAEIKLVHSYTLSSSDIVADDLTLSDFYKQIKEMEKEELKALTKMNFLKGIRVSNHIENDLKPWELVIDDKYKNADLIIIGTHGKNSTNKFFIGSNAEKIIRIADAPVLTVKKNDDNFNMKKMVFASDYRDESYSVFEKIKFFTDAYQAHIDLLKVITPKNFETTDVSKKLMDHFAKTFELTDYAINIYNDTTIEKGIIDFSNQQRTDLIAIETHGRTGINHIICGSLAEDVADDAKQPVLSIKIKNDQEKNKNLQQKIKDYENWGSE